MDFVGTENRRGKGRRGGSLENSVKSHGSRPDCGLGRGINRRNCLVHLTDTTVMAVIESRFPKVTKGEPVDSRRIAFLQRIGC